MKKLIAILILCGLIGVAGLAAAPSAPQATVEAAVSVPDPTVEELWVLTNKERQAAGMAALAIDQGLNSAALDKCNDMVAKNYYAHQTPEGNRADYFITKHTSNTGKWGENLAELVKTDDAEAVIDGWMDSPSHRAAILDPAYTRVGFGHCVGANFDYSVQHFAAN